MMRWLKRSKNRKEQNPEDRKQEDQKQDNQTKTAEPEDGGSVGPGLEEEPASGALTGNPEQTIDQNERVDDIPDQPDSGDQDSVEELAPENQKNGLLAKLKNKLAETRAVLTTRVDHLILGIKEIDDDVLEELEEILITSDLGVKTTQTLIDAIGKRIARHELNTPEKLKQVLREEVAGILKTPKHEAAIDVKPFVILVVGVNGVGKTTTLAKLAKKYTADGKKVMLVAADTFRAAAVEQLDIWSQRVGADIVKQRAGADPSAVVFDALAAAKARDTDIVLIDTAGRLHTKTNLMDELKKIKRVTGREMPGAPHELLLVLDATTGQNAVNQARMFNEAVGVTQLAMTKLDSTSKGGILVAIAHELGLPIKYIGLGEQMEDLALFDIDDFVDAIFG